MNIKHGELKIDGNGPKIIVMKDRSTLGILVFWLLFIIVYIINFIQLINAILEQNITMIIIKAIGVLTAFGSLITVWF